ncbi:zf-TFIIB domain-containing protein [Halomarina ordinaria]|uniref:Zf-TFIIB domain-containing protein n=1 Tax=Halomarina ordinaria TaxID=3033939 RepID=A0ABD5UCI9_9EURY|nr:zf-TFIIB domain-containing protein [Halomarina sp. PSRA2]
MTCPRCDSRLERYALGGGATHSCRRCGYLGVSVDHTSERRAPESWTAAFERFYGKE